MKILQTNKIFITNINKLYLGIGILKCDHFLIARVENELQYRKEVASLIF